MPVVSISLPEELLDRIDSFSEEHGYSGRSELVRDATRSLIGELEDTNLEGRELVATVTAVFEESGVEKEMIDLRHEYDGVVRSNVHSHIGEGHCMELFVLEGTLEDVRDFVGKVRSTSGVLSINYSVNPIDELS
ncbi:MAG: CopG family ribbon-helix-helix protein [Halobacteria archaeon]|nr:CopG family ribbon-helix-helix protein [Halobacteria archaeon]